MSHSLEEEERKTISGTETDTEETVKAYRGSYTLKLLFNQLFSVPSY